MQKMAKHSTSSVERLFDPVPDVIEEFKCGEMVIVTDDARRENEGDLICAAEKITPEIINFMVRFGRGLVCIAMAKPLIKRFGLSRMPREGESSEYNTAFLESVDARDGITTGISAHDRAHTINVLMDEKSTEKDIIRPGHIFPLEAHEGGLLERPGHTEAAVELARLAGLKSAGVICEIIRDDGRMARLPDLMEFSRHHGLMITSVADLITYCRNPDLPTGKKGTESANQVGP